MYGNTIERLDNYIPLHFRSSLLLDEQLMASPPVIEKGISEDYTLEMDENSFFVRNRQEPRIRAATYVKGAIKETHIRSNVVNFDSSSA